MTSNRTAGKTVKKRRTRRTTQKHRITFTVTGERYALLKRVADAMNKVSWCDNDNTPESVFMGFVEPFAGGLLDSPDELCEAVLTGIATSDDGLTDAPEPTHAARIAELDKAFNNLYKIRPLIQSLA